MIHSDSLAKIAPALVKALSDIGGVAKTKSNPGFKGSKYATLEDVIDASKPTLAENGLTVMQLPGALVSGVLTVETVILHESGEYVRGDFGIALAKADPQGVGSAVSYARRYALMAMLNMPAVDDDAETAMGRGDTAPLPSAHAARKTDMGPRADELKHEIATLESLAACVEWARQREKEIKTFPSRWQDLLRDELITQRALLMGSDSQEQEAA